MKRANDEPTFEQLGLAETLTKALGDVGYETPTSIQARTVPALLAGRDVIGQAQTGTGKTAAFALPILQRLDLSRAAVQALVLTPTRELAIQVAEAFHTYARRLGRVTVVPVYGGQPIGTQLARLKRGAHVVVGTPGRVMDHLRRQTLDLAALQTIVLDEADEMLRMGFIEDIEWILEQAPAERQTALFSATMPAPIRRIADRHLKDPETIEVAHRTLTVPTVEQLAVQVTEKGKLDALMQLLEVRQVPGEAVLVFVRTKLGAAEVVDKLQARGYAAEPLHGDMGQKEREQVVRRLRSGQTELVVATDVAARGLDVERIAQVINYDMPNDPEWYVHRIGRTARAGRTGSAVLFVTPREQRLKREIERFTRQPIAPMPLPSRADVAARRVALFKEQVVKVLEEQPLELYLELVHALAEESGRDMAEIAAATARLASGDRPLEAPEPEAAELTPAEEGMVRLFIDAGRAAGVRPQDIVGAIANEVGIPGRAIGSIDVYDRFTFVEVPAEHRDAVLSGMAGVRIRNREVRVKLARPEPGGFERAEREPRARRPRNPAQRPGPLGPAAPKRGRVTPAGPPGAAKKNRRG